MLVVDARWSCKRGKQGLNKMTKKKDRRGMVCTKCGSEAKPAKIVFQGHEIDGWQCGCGRETYLDPEQAQRILSLNKLRHEQIEAKLGRIRSNLILRIPTAIEEGMGLKEGEKVRLRVKSQHELDLVTA